MVAGLNIFKEYFSGYENQYVLIGGAACDVLFESNELQFRATRDLDIVLVVEALTPEFAEVFWDFIEKGMYRNKTSSSNTPQFYRFDKPQNKEYPKMIELFARPDFELKHSNGLTPIHVSDDISSLSAILLNDDYYSLLLEGKTSVNGLSVLRPEYLILFKAKAYLDLIERKKKGVHVDSRDIKKHKNDILRISTEFLLDTITISSKNIIDDISLFTEVIRNDPYEQEVLMAYGVSMDALVSQIANLYTRK